jgi:hypothetical protein
MEVINFNKKINNGKLINLNLNVKNNLLTVKIMGDFFLYPEEKITLLEDSINNFKLNINQINLNELETKISKIINENEINIIGFTPKDLSECIVEGLKLNQE